MKSSKERKAERKRKAKEVSVRKSDMHRKRRLDNKAKRAEIHAIDPDIKVKIVDQVTYDDLGTEIMVENGKIKTVEPEIMPLVLPKVQSNKQKMTEIGMFDKLTERFKKKDKIPPL